MIASWGRRMRGTLAAVSLVPLVAACSQGPSTPAKTSPAKTSPGKASPVTLTVWDELELESGKAEILELNAAFERSHPNVRIKRVQKNFSVLKKTLPTVAAGSSPPDVVQVNQGQPDMGRLVRAGLLLPLDRYADRYGWRRRFSSQMLNLNSFTPDGSRFGTGSLYGLSQSGELVGYYYNREKLRRLHLSPPASWSGMQAMLGEIKRRGELPVQFGDRDLDPGIHLFGTVLGQVAGKEYPRELVYDHRSESLNRPEAQTAARTVQDWVRRGYLPADTGRKTSDQAWQDFAKGSGVFLLQGTWLLGDLQKVMGNGAGFMLPPAEPAGRRVAVGGESLAFSVTARSHNHDAAAAYVDFVTGPFADAVLARTGNLPAVLPAGLRSAPGTLQGDVYEAWRATSREDDLTPYLDYATPTFYDTLTGELPRLLRLRTTPQSFVTALQEDLRRHTR
jgi:raffinose/stachyose/melibiose transport system substrate-binding protein